jgi:alkylated DNA repair dioxygenase AlkB
MPMLFPEAADLPEGFLYHDEIISTAEESALLDGLRALAFGEVRMRGQVARRSTIHFGWTYGYESWRVEPGPPLPDFLLGLRARVAPLAAVDAEALAEVLVTHYPPGAGIGWHRDAPAFGVVIGVSLLGTCRFRFQRGGGAARRTRTVPLAPRSAYVLAGAARWQWQHAIPPGRAERYSITFRTLRGNDRPR